MALVQWCSVFFPFFLIGIKSLSCWIDSKSDLLGMICHTISVFQVKEICRQCMDV